MLIMIVLLVTILNCYGCEIGFDIAVIIGILGCYLGEGCQGWKPSRLEVGLDAEIESRASNQQAYRCQAGNEGMS